MPSVEKTLQEDSFLRRGFPRVLRIVTTLLLGGLLSLTGAQEAYSEPLDTPETGATLKGAAFLSGMSGVSGATAFSVGESATSTNNATSTIEPATPEEIRFTLGALTALQYLCLMVFAGLILFQDLVLRSSDLLTHNSASVFRGAGIGAVVTSLLLVPVSALNVTGERFSSVLTVTAWWPGVFWGPMAATAVATAGVGGTAILSKFCFRRRETQWLRVVLAFLALSAPLLVGHSQLFKPRALIIAADLGHLVAGSFWAGGVTGLLLFLASVRSTAEQRADTDLLLAATVVGRFSRLAVWSVVILALSGTIMGVMIVGSIEALVSTGYGLTLLLKVSIVVAVIAIAVYNKSHMLPKLTTGLSGSTRWHILVRTLSYEAALLIAILLITGFLTNMSPKH